MTASGELRIQMPTDLRSGTRLTPLQLQFEADVAPRISSSRNRGITGLTVETPTSTRFTDEPAVLPRARWKSPEFIVYALVFVIAIPIMVQVPIRLSNSSHPNYPVFARRLSPGWIPGRYVDNSDSQYRSFRNNLIPLSFLASIFFIFSYIYDRVTCISSVSTVPASPNKLHRIPFLVFFSIIMILFLHGFSALKIIVIVMVNFYIAKFACSPTSPKYLGPILTWTFNGLILYLNEVYSGYSFAQVHSSLSFMDATNGFYPRWHISFNVTMLRLISFNMDYYWASKDSHRPIENSTTNLTTKQRPRIPHDLGLYSIANYISYILYPPLYIAGPIITFNDFLWQFRRPTPSEIPSTSRAYTLSYLARFLFCLFTMELILHYMYVVAIKDSSAWLGDSPLELCMVGFWNLIIVWLKLLIFWRFFRLWALLDGIDPPENMVRCMANNYSTLGFWRSWHRSYNLWLLRYLYIPVGGSRSPILSTLLVFTFVALWHDLSFRLLTWGWLVSLFIIPELAARWYFTPEKFGDQWWFRHICAIGGIFNILAMMSANLVGFAIGIEGMKYMIQKIFENWQGVRFLFFACVCLFAGVQVMFEYREEEKRKGVYRRY